MDSFRLGGLAAATLGVALAAAVAIGCSDPASAPGGGGGAGGGSGGAGGGGPECGASGVSKGPWSLAAGDAGATIRWQACRAGADGALQITPEAGGEPLQATSVETAYEVTTTYKAALNPNATPDWAGTWYLHEVALEGLAPGTCYRYHLGADPDRAGRFCTARPSPEPLRFLAIADTNPGLGETTSRLLEQALPYAPDFVLHAGDIQYYESGFDTWALWFERMQPMLAAGAFYPAVGNHESENEDEYADHLTRYFVTPGAESYHRFSSGGVHFFALDSEKDLDLGSLQGTWLSAALEAAVATPGFRLSIVYLHRPLVTCGDKGSDDAARAQLAPLFAAHGVRLVLQGHMHGYERFELDGLTYITTAGGGGALGDVDENLDRPECASRLASGALFHALLVDVEPTEIRTRAIDEQGAVRDEWSAPIP